MALLNSGIRLLDILNFSAFGHVHEDIGFNKLEMRLDLTQLTIALCRIRSLTDETKSRMDTQTGGADNFIIKTCILCNILRRSLRTGCYGLIQSDLRGCAVFFFPKHMATLASIR